MRSQRSWSWEGVGHLIWSKKCFPWLNLRVRVDLSWRDEESDIRQKQWEVRSKWIMSNSVELQTADRADHDEKIICVGKDWAFQCKILTSMNYSLSYCQCIGGNNLMPVKLLERKSNWILFICQILIVLSSLQVVCCLNTCCVRFTFSLGCPCLVLQTNFSKYQSLYKYRIH